MNSMLSGPKMITLNIAKITLLFTGITLFKYNLHTLNEEKVPDHDVTYFVTKMVWGDKEGYTWKAHTGICFFLISEKKKKNKNYSLTFLFNIYF